MFGKKKEQLTIEELTEQIGKTIILGVTGNDLKTLKDGDVAVFSGKLFINGEPITVKLVPNSRLSVVVGKKEGAKP
jgi:hypothetical protein